MATHSSVLAWRIPGTEEPVGLPSTRSRRVGHDQSDLEAVLVLVFFFFFLIFILEYWFLALLPPLCAMITMSSML